MPALPGHLVGLAAPLQRNTTKMIALLLRLLLVLQLLAVATLSTLIYQRLLPTHAAWSAAFGLATVVLIRLAITANSFRLSRRYRSAPAANARIHPGTATRLFFTEFFSSMLSSSWTMAFCAFSKRTMNNPVGLPVLLVHGYGCNSGYWHAMSNALAAARISHHAVTLEPVFGSIDDYLPAVHQAIAELLDESASTRLILLGHSMGGLVCRAYLRDYGSASVAKVITVGSPHHGTALANSGIGKNVQQMAMHFRGDHAKSSTWLRQLGESETTATRALIVSIYSHHDNIVAPQRSAYLDGASNIALDAIGHVTLAMHQQVQQHVIAQIALTS